MYFSVTALLAPPNGIGLIAGVFIAVVDAAGFIVGCLAARAAEFDRLRTTSYQ